MWLSMVKRLEKLVAIVCVCLLFMLATACSYEKINTRCALTDCYLDGIFTENDIQNIAALRVGYVAIVKSLEQDTEDYRKIDFKETSFDPLTDEQKAKIKSDYEKLHEGMKMTEFKIAGYYGNYNGRYVVELTAEWEGYSHLTSVEKVIVANVYLGYIDAAYEFFIWQPAA